MKITTLAHCMDIFDWFDDPLYEYIYHILVSKLNGEARVQQALDCLIDRAAKLVADHHGTEAAYPVDFWNQPA